jgi:hypothetical protein
MILAIVAAGAAHSRLDASAGYDDPDSFVPSPRHARISSLGFDALLADFYWLRAVQLVGDSGGRTEALAPVIGRLIDVVTSLDPWVGHAYRFAAVWLVNSAEEVLQANRLLERGVAHHPREWRNRYHLGFNHYFYLQDYATAAEVLAPAIDLPGAPRYLARLVARLRSDESGLETAAAFLAQMARDTGDEFARAEYLKALDEIETERRARGLDAARVAYWERYRRDIDRVEDLLSGPEPMLRRLPPAHPHFDGWSWEIDAESGRIQSSFYRNRYELHENRLDRERRQRFQHEFQRIREREAERG